MANEKYLNRAIEDRNSKFHGFGVGSFQFSVEINSSLTLRQHIIRFKTELESIEGISNVDIEPRLLSPTRLSAGEVRLDFLDVQFDIELGNRGQTTKNKFRFVSRSFYDAHISLIFSKFQTDSPSRGVILVREYLKAKLGNGYSVTVTGPSPFHADFYITGGGSFDFTLEKTIGYDKIKIGTALANSIEIEDLIYEKLGHELNVFYLIRTIEVDRIDEWIEVNSLVNSASRRIPFLSFAIEDQFSALRHDYLREAMLALSTFESDSLMLDQQIEERYSNFYRTGTGYLKVQIDQEKSERYKYSIESLQKLLEFTGQMRSQSQTTRTTYINTVVNVLLGIAVSVALYKFGLH